MHVAGRLTPEQFWQRIAAGEQRIRDSAAFLPLYGMADPPAQPAMLGDWEWQDGDLVKAGLSFGDPLGAGPLLHVRTTTRPLGEEVALARLAGLGPARNKADHFDRWRAAHDGPAAALDVSIDGSVVRFDQWPGGDRWWAAGEHDGYGVVIEARRLPAQSLILIRIHDIEPYLAGRRSYLRSRRGERG